MIDQDVWTYNVIHVVQDRDGSLDDHCQGLLGLFGSYETKNSMYAMPCYGPSGMQCIDKHNEYNPVFGANHCLASFWTQTNIKISCDSDALFQVNIGKKSERH